MKLLLALLLAAGPASAQRPENRVLEAAAAELVFELTNAERAKAGLPPLRRDPAAASAGAGHSAEMARLDYFEHESPTPGRRTHVQRARAAGAEGAAFGENIAVHTLSGMTLQEIAAAMLASLMASPPHRANVLSRDFTRLGVGAAIGRFQGREAVYATQVFLGP